MSTILRTVGIDISKDWLDAFAAPEGRASRFSNDLAGFRKLIAWIGAEVDRIAYEPSGPFHRDLEETLLKAGLPLYAINPFQVRSFARSLGRRAKTDAVDARMLATMAAAVEDLRPTEARSEGQRDLAELQQIRDALRKDRVATINRGKHLRTPVGKRVTKQRLEQIDRQLKLIDAEIRRRLGEEKTLERRAEILTSIPGISNITAAGLIVLMPELGALTGARAASLAGLAPVTRESGHWKGRSFIQGGRHRVRRLLYMPSPTRSCSRTASGRRIRRGNTPAPPSRRPARRAAVTDDRAEEEASKPRRREGSCATGRFEKKGHPLDMDTPVPSVPAGRPTSSRSDGRIRLNAAQPPQAMAFALRSRRTRPSGRAPGRCRRLPQGGG